MASTSKTEAIKAFLSQFAPPDLAALYNHDMEVQVIVAKDNGERTEGDYKGRMWHGYTDGLQVWKPIRIPLNANTEPEFTDSPMTYDLLAHAEGIGMTGWDWKARTSRWVAFDFDAIVGHSEKHSKKLNDEELSAIRQAVANIPWVTVRKSAGGKGLHLYCFLEPIETANHNDHAAVGRAILSHMSGIAGFDLNSKVDICGGNMWVWHRKMKGTDGLTIIKESTELVTVPSNWRDYTKVITGRRHKNLPKFIEDQTSAKSDIEDVFDELTGQRLRVKPDAEHKKVMDWIFENYNSSWWDAENHMLITHTAILKEAHSVLNLKGRFDTLATGAQKGADHNCFMFPMSKGGWAVRRYSLGVAEHATWEQDGAGWTRCFFNREPNLHTAAKSFEGVERREGGYWLQTADQAQQAALLLGVNLGLPNWVLGKPTILNIHKTGKLLVEIEKDNNSPPLPGWLVKGKKFERMFDMKNPTNTEPEVMRLDDSLRHLVSEQFTNYGWVVKSDGYWHEESNQNVSAWLKSKGYKDPALIMGGSVDQCWMLVNRPFKEEYPRDRQWNRDAAQLRYKPSVNRDNLKYPTWLKILNHIGKSLDDVISRHQWCRANGIQTGADYLKIWIASLFQEPLEPLPYLFLYGPQNSGKSILHEALALLMTRGVVRADQALISQAGFNGELEHAVLCIIEETDMRKNATAYNRIKDWVTSRMIPIHAKGQQPYSVVNSSHWIQCANTHMACPIFNGDSRITMIFVDSLEEIIPKKQIIPLLEAEAPDFVAEILGLELPISPDRLGIPVIATEDKIAAEYSSQSPLELFIEEKTFRVQGHMIRFGEFYERFLEFLDPNLVGQWTRKRVAQEFPPQYPRGRWSGDSQHYIGNMALEPGKYQLKPKLISRDGKLIHDEDMRKFEQQEITVGGSSE